MMIARNFLDSPKWWANQGQDVSSSYTKDGSVVADFGTEIWFTQNLICGDVDERCDGAELMLLWRAEYEDDWIAPTVKCTPESLAVIVGGLDEAIEIDPSWIARSALQDVADNGFPGLRQAEVLEAFRARAFEICEEDAAMHVPQAIGRRV